MDVFRFVRGRREWRYQPCLEAADHGKLAPGDDDRMFPSTVFSALIMQRLAEHHHPHADQHLHYQGAGHFVSFPYGYPYLPPFVKRVQGLAVGGTVEDTAASVADSWPKILAFFEGSISNVANMGRQL